jgi:hypothetical protein
MVPFKLLCLKGQDSTCRYVRCNTLRRADLPDRRGFFGFGEGAEAAITGDSRDPRGRGRTRQDQLECAMTFTGTMTREAGQSPGSSTSVDVSLMRRSKSSPVRRPISCGS